MQLTECNFELESAFEIKLQLRITKPMKRVHLDLDLVDLLLAKSLLLLISLLFVNRGSNQASTNKKKIHKFC